MKNFLKNVGNFFKKIGLFIWKYLKIAWNYIKENAWIQPIAIVALIFGLVFGFQGIVNGIEKIKAANETENNNAKNRYKKVTMNEVRTMLKDKKDFVLFIGAHDCGFCQEFKTVVNKYVESTGKDIYYIDIRDTSDTSIDRKYLVEWAEMLADIDTRDFKGTDLSTPTVVVIKKGKFEDAKSGAQGLSGGMEYLNFVKFVEGKYIGKIESSK